jgi:hypothetical protein
MTEHIYEPPHNDPASTAFLTGDLFPTGNETIPRTWADSFASLGGTGLTMLTSFTAYRTEQANFVACQTGSAGAGATPTLCKMGLFLVNNPNSTALFDYTLLTATANDTTLFASAYQPYKRALLTPYTLQAGTRYAFGVLIVSTFAMPNLVVSSYGLNDSYGSAILMPNTAPAITQRAPGADLGDIPHGSIQAAQAGFGKIWAYFSNT